MDIFKSINRENLTSSQDHFPSLSMFSMLKCTIPRDPYYSLNKNKMLYPRVCINIDVKMLKSGGCGGEWIGCHLMKS